MGTMQGFGATVLCDTDLACREELTVHWGKQQTKEQVVTQHDNTGNNETGDRVLFDMWAVL